MGFSDSVPGYSGGTTLNLLNFYNPFVFRLRQIFKKNSWSNWFKNILWLLPFLIFWVISLFSFSFISKFLSKNNYDLFLIFLFISFSLFCIPLFIYEQKIKLKNNLFIKENKKNNFITSIFIILGFLLFLGISIGVYLNGGISLKHKDIVSTIVEKSKWWKLIVVAFVSGFVMLIPGISGQLMFYITDLYKDFSWVILQNPIQNIGILSLILLSMFTGIVLSIFFINILNKKCLKYFTSFCIGLVCGSPLAILFGMIGNNEYIIQLQNIYNFPLLFSSLFLAILIGLVFNIFLFAYSFIKQFKLTHDLNQTIIVFCDNKNMDNVYKKMVYLYMIKKYKIKSVTKSFAEIVNDNNTFINCLKSKYKRK